MNITPEGVVLTSGQGATFEARSSDGQSLKAIWTYSPAMGNLIPLPTDPPTPAASVTYVAVSPVPTAATVVLIARAGDDSASATIDLTLDSVTVIPAKVDLKA